MAHSDYWKSSLSQQRGVDRIKSVWGSTGVVDLGTWAASMRQECTNQV